MWTVYPLAMPALTFVGNFSQSGAGPAASPGTYKLNITSSAVKCTGNTTCVIITVNATCFGDANCTDAVYLQFS